DGFVEFGIEPEGAAVVDFFGHQGGQLSRLGAGWGHSPLHRDCAACDCGGGGAGGDGGTGCLDSHVEVLIGQGVGADPDGAVNADVQGDLQRVIEDVRGPDFGGAGGFAGPGGEDADRSGSADEDLGAGDAAGSVQRVQANCQRFGQ